MAKIVGHTFLAKLGKKRLRPGGAKATNWLLKQADFDGIDMLEVATNMATTSTALAKKYDIRITAVDIDVDAIDKAKVITKKNGVSKKIDFERANATSLPFEDNSYEVVLNEAMLTMLPEMNKQKAVAEYYRVLKPGGKLLTHDVYLNTDDTNLQAEIIGAMKGAINHFVEPKTLDNWKKLFKDAGFKNIEHFYGPMTLMRPIGMIRDEGLINTIKIRRNGRKPENQEQFNKLRGVFKKYHKYLGFIAVASEK